MVPKRRKVRARYMRNVENNNEGSSKQSSNYNFKKIEPIRENEFENDINFIPSSKKENVYLNYRISSNVYDCNKQKNSSNEINDINKTKNNNYIIDKIKLGKCWVYVLFLCCKKRKDVNNILFDEAMRIISENLDIINVFKKIYKKDVMEKFEVIEMSDKCRDRLRELSGIYH